MCKQRFTVVDGIEYAETLCKRHNIWWSENECGCHTCLEEMEQFEDVVDTE